MSRAYSDDRRKRVILAIVGDGMSASAAVMNALRFHNTGPSQIPGLIVTSLSDAGGARLVTIINAAPETREFALDLGRDFALHPVLQESGDSIVRASSYDAAAKIFTTPGRTVAVFVAQSGGGKRGAAKSPECIRRYAS